MPVLLVMNYLTLLCYLNNKESLAFSFYMMKHKEKIVLHLRTWVVMEVYILMNNIICFVVIMKLSTIIYINLLNETLMS